MMGRFPFLAFLTLMFGGLGYLALRAASPEGEEEVRSSLSVTEILGGDAAEGFARALEPRPFRFPEDHGPHPEFRTEWWYLTGNLEGPEGRAFGFQFTIFRSALEPHPPQGESDWATHQVYMGHFAVTDVEGETFRAFERFSRGAQGLAGARAEPFRVWLEDWVLEGPGGGLFPLTLRAAEEDRGLELTLRPEKPLVLQGNEGLSQKGVEAGNASYYYSFTRLDAEGTLFLDGKAVPVRGQAWLDREWSTSVLSPGQVGWDWFALQLEDGRDLMYYQLRLADGTPDPLSKGILVAEDGESRILTAPEVDLTVLDRWEREDGGAVYPSRWRLSVPGEGLDLEVAPVLANQELDLTFRYWEGAVRVRGTDGSEQISGRGYVELTGYSGDLETRPSTSISRGNSRP